jgi:hypothetical protein
MFKNFNDGWDVELQYPSPGCTQYYCPQWPYGPGLVDA